MILPSQCSAILYFTVQHPFTLFTKRQLSHHFTLNRQISLFNTRTEFVTLLPFSPTPLLTIIINHFHLQYHLLPRFICALLPLHVWHCRKRVIVVSRLHVCYVVKKIIVAKKSSVYKWNVPNARAYTQTTSREILRHFL